MLLILLLVTCLHPNQCSITGMKSFDPSTEGVRAACHELYSGLDEKHKKGLTVMYAQGLNVKMSSADGACVATPEKLNPQEYRKVFFDNLWK